MPLYSRRRFLQGSAAVTGAMSIAQFVAPAALAQDVPTTPAGDDWVRVYLIVIDGLRADEVSQMPTLTQLATDGWYFPDSRAQMIAETTPNHVSMITGMRVDRHGMPGNDVAYLADNIGTMPRYLQTDSIYSLIARQAPDLVATAATSKEYIVQMTKHMRVDEGAEDADATNDPMIVPVSGHAIDAEVGPDALEQSQQFDPDFGWMSLGDVDRVGHSDFSGATGLPPVARTLSLQTADQQVGNLIAELQDSGRWDNTVVLVTADHAMDWSTPDSVVSLFSEFEDTPELAGQTGVAQNGGAAIYWLLAPEAADVGERLKQMRDIALATDGVAEAWYTRPNPADGGEEFWVGTARPDWGLTGDRTGDLVVVAADGYRITEPEVYSNPIPGNHGHIVTIPIPAIVAGGWDGLNANDVVPGSETPPEEADGLQRPPGQAENIDMAPTIAWLLGINPPPGGFDGRVLTEAFSRRPQPRIPIADVPSVPRYREIAGASRQATSVELSRAAFPDEAVEAVTTVVVASGEDFPDALAATPLAIANAGPLLLTAASRLDDVVTEEITRLDPSTVFIVGGEAALSAEVEQAIRDLGIETVTRLAGTSRYGTAAEIARQLLAGGAESSGGGVPAFPPEGFPPEGFPPLPPLGGFTQDGGDPGPDVIVASGQNFPDALVAGPLAGLGGRIVVLTRPGDLPEETAAVLGEINPARIIIAGGEEAVSEAVAGQLAQTAIVERLAGPSRFETAAELVERTIREGGLTDRAYVVDGGGFPDALAAGAAVAAMGGMLIPLSEAGLGSSGAMAELLQRRADGLVEVVYVGGTSAVPESLRAEVEQAILQRRTRHKAADVPTPVPTTG